MKKIILFLFCITLLILGCNKPKTTFNILDTPNQTMTRAEKIIVKNNHVYLATMDLLPKGRNNIIKLFQFDQEAKSKKVLFNTDSTRITQLYGLSITDKNIFCPFNDITDKNETHYYLSKYDLSGKFIKKVDLSISNEETRYTNIGFNNNSIFIEIYNNSTPTLYEFDNDLNKIDSTVFDKNTIISLTEDYLCVVNNKTGSVKTEHLKTGIKYNTKLNINDYRRLRSFSNKGKICLITGERTRELHLIDINKNMKYAYNTDFEVMAVGFMPKEITVMGFTFDHDNSNVDKNFVFLKLNEKFEKLDKYTMVKINRDKYPTPNIAVKDGWYYYAGSYISKLGLEAFWGKFKW